MGCGSVAGRIAGGGARMAKLAGFVRQHTEELDSLHVEMAGLDRERERDGGRGGDCQQHRTRDLTPTHLDDTTSTARSALVKS